MNEQLKIFLQQIHPVADVILEEYLQHWQEYQVPRKAMITHKGEVQKHAYFVLEGMQKSYYLHEGKEHVIAFTYPPSFSGIPESFFTQLPSHYFLQAISDSKFLRISFERHQQMMEKYRPIETLMRKATEHLLAGVIERHYELMALDIETRFRNFAQRSPHLLNLLSQKDIASYLRIDPTNLSKLLNQVRL